jgi:predicted amino acid-binding ACT domain protein
MFDKLIEIISNWWLQLTPIIIIRDYEKAVLLRFGKFKKVLEPGIHFKIPMFDEVIDQHVVTTTLSLDAQSLYTADKQNIVVKGLVKYKIADVKIFLLEVWDAQDAISDMSQAIIKNVIMSMTLDECTDSELDNTLTKKVRVEAKKWGVEVEVRELELGERQKILIEKGYSGLLYSNAKNYKSGKKILEVIRQTCDDVNIPTKVISFTYNNETIENYE